MTSRSGPTNTAYACFSSALRWRYVLGLQLRPLCPRGQTPHCALNRLRGTIASYKTLWREEMSLVLQGIELQFPVVKSAVEGPTAGRMVLVPIGKKYVT
jgi:hypothetical protein